MRKSAEAPRKLYARKGQALVLFTGKLYGAPKNSVIPLDGEVTCEPVQGGKIEVTFRKPGTKNVVEVWSAKRSA